MTFSKPALDSEERPTLPSIHTLNLPLLSRPKQTHVKYQNHDNLVRILHLYPLRRLTYLLSPRHVRHSITMVVKSPHLLHIQVHRVPFRRHPLPPLATPTPKLITQILIRTQNSV
jgi:hypothetical protein